MRIRRRYSRAPIVLAIASVVAGCAGQASRQPGQFVLRMRPVAPLTTTACISEARSYGYSAEGGASICAFGGGRQWYQAVLINKGPGAYPACQATGFDAHGTAVFTGQLPLTFAGFPAGLFAKGHRSTAFYWYLPQTTRRPVARYTATCSVNSNPPI